MMPSLSCIANEDTNAPGARFISAEIGVAVNLAGEPGARRRSEPDICSVKVRENPIRGLLEYLDR